MKSSDPFADLIRSIEENLQRGGDWVPPGNDSPPRRVSQPSSRPNRFWWLMALPLLFLLLYNTIVGFLADWSWHASLNFESILWTRLVAAGGLFAAGFLLTALFLLANFVPVSYTHLTLPTKA